LFSLAYVRHPLWLKIGVLFPASRTIAMKLWLHANGNMQSGRLRDPTRQWSGLIRSGAARTSPDFPPHDAIAHREMNNALNS
jgi:hypothetical protein